VTVVTTATLGICPNVLFTIFPTLDAIKPTRCNNVVISNTNGAVFKNTITGTALLIFFFLLGDGTDVRTGHETATKRQILVTLVAMSKPYYKTKKKIHSQNANECCLLLVQPLGCTQREYGMK
jgi:hypothetical protein